MRRLNLGCGNQSRKDFINIDDRPLPGVDIVRNLLRGLPFDDGSVDEIYSENFLEHLPQTECIWMMNEMHRVMRSGGLMTHLIPLAGSVNFWQDPTHLAHWHPETFTYFQKDHRRNLYYGGDIKPWVVETPIEINVNSVMFVRMTKP